MVISFAHGPDAERIRVILEAQRAAQVDSGPPTLEQRIDRLDRAIGLLVDHEAEIVAAVVADFGHRSPDFTRLTEVLSPMGSLKLAKAQLADWMQPEQRISDRGEAWVSYEPLGVIGIVAPWNFPMNLAFTGLAGVLAAGNRAMIKPSEFTPRSSALLAEMISSAFAPDEVTVITGGPDIGQAFCSQPFDHLLFTGATSIGRHVLRAAAEHLTPVTLELGGKSPTIVSRSADIEAAATRIICGKMHNAGQICVSPDHVFVPEESVEAFVAAAGAALARHFPSLKENPDFTSVINSRHFERLQRYVAEARAAGVETIELNPANEDFSDQAHRKMPPTLLIDPDDGLQVMQDEIFGPLLPIKPYKFIAEVIAYINARPHPLSLYYFGEDADEEAFVLSRTRSGGVTINDVIRHVGVETLPFGGIGPSGMGAYRGRDGFRNFSNSRAMLRAGDGPDIMRPPYAEQTRQIIRSLISR